jgi:HD superfamily phosphohydrolase
MLNVVDNQLVVEEKGLLGVENFLVARRLMYWQVYLHKTSICSETMVLKIFERVKDLLEGGIKIEIPRNLEIFIDENINLKDFNDDEKYLQSFIQLDDTDIWFALKSWQCHEDQTLSLLCKNLIERNLFKIKIEVGLATDDLEREFQIILSKHNISKPLQKYYYKIGNISNSGYASQDENIKILMKNGTILDVSEASDLPTIKAMSNIVKKNYICYANEVYLPTI